MTKRILAAAALAALAAGPALAQVQASAATDLNLRAGPGPAFEILSVIPAEGMVDVTGCLADANWCQVNYEGTEGWAFGEYLNAMMEEQPVAVIEAREPLQIVTIERPAETAASDAAVGAAAAATVAGALIGGPIAIAAGAALGAAAAAGADSEPAVTYIRENPVEPVYLEGEVVVGAGIPEEVELVAVPDTNWGYLNVNGLPVLVDMSNRQIVRIVR
jgi:uncharacterized protein YraI